MAKEVVASKVINTVGWKFDPSGLKDLQKFKSQLKDLKKDMKGLGTEFKPARAMSDVKNITKKIKKDVEKIEGLHPFAMKGRNKREALTEHARLMNLQQRVLKKKGQENLRIEKDAAKEKNRILENLSKEALKKEKSEMTERANLLRLQQRVRKRVEQEALRDQKVAAREKNKILSDLSRQALQKEREHVRDQKREADRAARAELQRARELQRVNRERMATAIRLRSARGQFETTIGRGRLSKDEIDLANRKWKQLTRSWRDGQMSSAHLLAGIKDLNRGLRDQSRGVGTLIYKLKKLRSTSLIAAAAMGTFMGSMAVAQTGKEFEQMDLMFKTVFGDRAQEDMAFITQEADRLGINLLKSAKNYAKIAFAAKEAGLTLEDQRKTYVALAEASIVFGQTQDQLMRSMKAVEQMLSKGRVGSEELRQQFGEHMPGAVSIAAKAIGKTTEELNDMMQQGKLASNVFIPQLAAALRELAAPHLAEGLRHLAREEARTINAWNEFKNTIFDAGLGKALIYFNRLITDLLKASTPIAKILGRMALDFTKLVAIADMFISALRMIPWWIGKAAESLKDLLPTDLIDFFKKSRGIWRKGLLGTVQEARNQENVQTTPQKDTMTNNVRNKIPHQTQSGALGIMPGTLPQQGSKLMVELSDEAKELLKVSQDPASDLAADVAR